MSEQLPTYKSLTPQETSAMIAAVRDLDEDDLDGGDAYVLTALREKAAIYALPSDADAEELVCQTASLMDAIGALNGNIEERDPALRRLHNALLPSDKELRDAITALPYAESYYTQRREALFCAVKDLRPAPGVSDDILTLGVRNLPYAALVLPESLDENEQQAVINCLRELARVMRPENGGL